MTSVNEEFLHIANGADDSGPRCSTICSEQDSLIPTGDSRPLDAPRWIVELPKRAFGPDAGATKLFLSREYSSPAPVPYGSPTAQQSPVQEWSVARLREVNLP